MFKKKRETAQEAATQTNPLGDPLLDRNPPVEKHCNTVHGNKSSQLNIFPSFHDKIWQTMTEPFTDEVTLQNDLVFLAHGGAVSWQHRPESRIIDLQGGSVGEQDGGEIFPLI